MLCPHVPQNQEEEDLKEGLLSHTVVVAISHEEVELEMVVG